MGNAYDVRARSAPDTQYSTFRKVHAQRNANDNSDNVIDLVTGQSPTMRVMTLAFSWEDVDTSGNVEVQIPTGTCITNTRIRVDEQFVGAGAATTIGDTAQPAGFLAATD